jgi:hypothetical protein
LLFYFAICRDAVLQVQALSRSPLFEGAAASNLVLLATNVQAGTSKDVHGVFGRTVEESTCVSPFDALTNGQHVLHITTLSTLCSSKQNYNPKHKNIVAQM